MSSVDSTTVALIGAGFIAEFHLEILKRDRGIEVVAIVDPAVDRAESLGRRFGGIPCYPSIDAMVASVRPKVAHVLVPPHLHVPVTEELISHGIGAFVEKPLATDLASARSLADKAEAAGVPLGVNHNNLYHPGFRQLEDAVNSGRLGRLEHLFACLHVPLRQLDARDYRHWMFKEPRNIVFEQGPHPFSQIHRLLGPVRSVSSVRSGRRELGPGVPFWDTWQLSLECERGPATVLLSFGRGFGESWLHAIGQDGSLRVDLLRRHSQSLSKKPWLDFFDQWQMAQGNSWRLAWEGARNAANYVLSTARLRQRTDVFYVGMRDAMLDFHRALREGKAPPVDGRSATEVVEYCEKATEGIATPEPRTVEMPAPQEDGEGEEILVTGATGFLGGHLVPRLLRDGVKVRLLVRSPDQMGEHLRVDGVSVVRGDISDKAAVDRAVRGSKAVIHLATGAVSSWEAIEASMIGGLENLLDACRRFQVPRLLFTSTIAALDLGDGSAPQLTEEEGVDRRPDARALYARGKIACEKRIAQNSGPGATQVTVFRPGVVVGRGGLVQHSGVGLWTRDTECFGWGTGKHGLPFVLVEDVADAMARSLQLSASAGRTYNLVGEVKPTAREYIDELRQRSGRVFRYHPQPLWLFQTIEICKWLVKKATRRPGVQWPSFRDLKSRSCARPFDISRARRELGWAPEADRERFLQSALGEFVAAQEGADRTATPLWSGPTSNPSAAPQAPSVELGSQR